MKKVITYTLITFTLLGIFVYWMAYEGGKSMDRWELKKERTKIFEQEKKEYMSKIDQVGLFGIFLRGDPSFWLKNFDKNELGLYKGKKFKGWDTNPIDKEFSIQVSPTQKNLNFIDYYVSYDPFSKATYKIIGVLPKKFIDFIPESSSSTLGTIITIADIEQNYKKCIDYLIPFIEIIHDGIQNKTDLLSTSDYEPSKNSKKRIYRKYFMNSGIKYIWGDNDSQTVYFDKSPEPYYGILNSNKVFHSNEMWEKYRTEVLELVGHCNPHNVNENLYITLSHSIIKNWVHAKAAPVYFKKKEKQKLNQEEKALQKKKLSIDNTGLQ